MPRYVYRTRDAVGNTDSGALVANDSMEASRILRQNGGFVVSLHEEANALQSGYGRKRRIRKDDVIYFAMQLAVMVDTGVPLTEGLDAIAEQSDNENLREVVQDLSDQVKGGTAFSAALQKYPRLFSRLFVALMRASEASGTMGQMLQRISEYMEQERETRKRVKGALTYPACMMIFCVLVVIALLVFIMPRFEAIYAGKGAMLPLPTRILMNTSGFLIAYWPFLMLATMAAGIGVWFYVQSDAGRLFVARVQINLPVLGKMYRRSYLARSLRTMATMVSSGVSMLDGLSITAQASGNKCYEKVWLELADGVKEGATLSDQLYQCKLIPRTVTQMIAAGERTGQLETVMNRVAKFCEDELKVSVKTITSLIEPAMIIFMGFVVGGIALALLLPVLRISSVIAH